MSKLLEFSVICCFTLLSIINCISIYCHELILLHNTHLVFENWPLFSEPISALDIISFISSGLKCICWIPTAQLFIKFGLFSCLSIFFWIASAASTIVFVRFVVIAFVRACNLLEMYVQDPQKVPSSYFLVNIFWLWTFYSPTSK